MNRLNYKKIIIVLFLIIISVYLLIMFWHYFQYKNTLNRQNREIKIEEKIDFAQLKKKDDAQLANIGLNIDDINALRNIDLDNISLIGILSALNIELDESNVITLSYVNIKESSNGNQYVILDIEPVEAIYVPQNETTYLKILYEANIQKPMFRQGQDRLILRNNDWVYLFGYSKLHYVSKNGGRRCQYIGINIPGKISIDFKLRNKLEDEIFYLKGISGCMIVKKNGYTDISTYSEYDHLQLFNYKRISQHWSDFFLHKHNKNIP